MEILSSRHCIIGEGPIWNCFDKKLYQVNALGNEILIMDIYKKEVSVRKLPFIVAAIAFGKKGEMLVSCQDGAYILNSDNSRTPLCKLIKYGNDAKVGPDGRFYIGTQSSKRVGVSDIIDGKLYSIDAKGNVKILLDNLRLSNGMEWSIDEKYFYHTDSDTGIIKEYHFDKQNGSIEFSGREVSVPGVDGFTIGQNGFLYVACWGKGHIAVVDTADMQIKEYISVSANIPASCCFAGKNMEKLAVVTASLNSDLKNDKNAGFTFISEINTSGRKPFLFA